MPLPQVRIYSNELPIDKALWREFLSISAASDPASQLDVTKIELILSGCVLVGGEDSPVESFMRGEGGSAHRTTTTRFYTGTTNYGENSLATACATTEVPPLLVTEERRCIPTNRARRPCLAAQRLVAKRQKQAPDCTRLGDVEDGEGNGNGNQTTLENMHHPDAIASYYLALYRTLRIRLRVYHLDNLTPTPSGGSAKTTSRPPDTRAARIQEGLDMSDQR